MGLKKVLCTIFALLFMSANCGIVYAIEEVSAKPQAKKAQKVVKNTEIAFIFDGISDKNDVVLKTFKQTIEKSLAPDFKAVFSDDLIFVGDWTEEGAVEASDKAIKSRAPMIISLGYMSSMYLIDKKVNKHVVTIDEYGLRDFGSSAFFNPLKQYVNDFILFKKLVPTQQKTAVLMSQNYYDLHKDWNSIIKSKFKEKNVELDFVIVPVNHKDLNASLGNIPEDVDSVFVTPMFNLTSEQRKELYDYVNGRKLASFSSIGKEDVELGALLGTSTPDVDRKLAESTSFSIRSVLYGGVVQNEKIPFYDDKVIFYNKDTGVDLGYSAPLRLLNNCQIISNKEKPVYDLAYVFNTMEEQNLDIKRKKYLVDAARRSTYSAYLKYLPTLRMDLGYQTYDDQYAKSYTDVPTHVGQFTFGIDQMIYAPDLVTNIIVKHKKLKFDKAERILTEQALGLNLGFLYIENLMFENIIKVQEEYVKETRENLAIARVREKTGVAGKEETLRWAGQVSEAEKKLLSMKADYNNNRIIINKILFKDQKEDYKFKPLNATDPAFFTSDIHVIDHVRTPEKLEKFTEMLVAEAQYRSPETIKLKAAIAMKKAEMANYMQKFILPNAKMSVEFGSQFDRNLPYQKAGEMSLMSANYYNTGVYAYPDTMLDRTSTRFLIAAQWKPIEGGQKIAEIARCKAELNELKTYLTQVNTEIEMNVREVINRAISKYFMIEKSYKAMFAEAENYQTVKAKYLRGQAPLMQLVDAQELYTKAKIDALNSQNDFFKELIWVQRGLVNINWTKADDGAKDFIQKIKDTLPAEPDFTL